MKEGARAHFTLDRERSTPNGEIHGKLRLILGGTVAPSRRSVLERIVSVYGEGELSEAELDELVAARIADAQHAGKPKLLELETFDSVGQDTTPVHVVICNVKGKRVGALGFDNARDRDRVLAALRTIEVE